MAMTITPHDDTEFETSGRRRKITKFALAGVAVLGVGAALTSAAWTDNVFFGGTRRCGATSNSQGRRPATRAGSVDADSPSRDDRAPERQRSTRSAPASATPTTCASGTTATSRSTSTDAVVQVGGDLFGLVATDVSRRATTLTTARTRPGRTRRRRPSPAPTGPAPTCQGHRRRHHDRQVEGSSSASVAAPDPDTSLN